MKLSPGSRSSPVRARAPDVHAHAHGYEDEDEDILRNRTSS